MDTQELQQPLHLAIVRFYQELAPPLAQRHEIPHPADLARVMSHRLELLCNARLN